MGNDATLAKVGLTTLDLFEEIEAFHCIFKRGIVGELLDGMEGELFGGRMSHRDLRLGEG